MRDLAERKPTELGPWFARLLWQVQRKQPQSAAATVEQIRAKVKSDRPEYLWAQCYRRVGDLAHALEFYDIALKKWPQDLDVVKQAVSFYQSTGRGRPGQEATVQGGS